MTKLKTYTELCLVMINSSDIVGIFYLNKIFFLTSFTMNVNALGNATATVYTYNVKIFKSNYKISTRFFEMLSNANCI